MIPQPLGIMNDDENPNRMSRSKDWRRVLAWLENIRPAMGDGPYRAYRGWHVARMAAEDGDYASAVRYYVEALAHRVLPPSLAVKALLQILVRRSIYARFR
jgi:hypothetical protein